MRNLISVVLFLSQAVMAEPRSFSLVLSGVNGQPPNPNVERALREMLGDFVKTLTVKRLILRGIPEGGGFDVCIEPTEPQGFNYIIGELNSIGVNPGSATWTPELVESCDPPPLLP